HRTEAPHRVFIQLPHLVAYRMVMRVEEMGPMIAMAGEMELHHAIDRYRIDIGARVEAMVERAHENIVHVEQNSAVRLIRDRGKKLPLGHRGIAKRQVARYVHDKDRPFEEILHLRDTRTHMANGLGSVRKR